jgi:integrase
MAHMKALKRLQKQDKLAAGDAYPEGGYLVADALGRPCHPETLSGWFEQAVKECRAALEDDETLRRISLHGCRHTCATLMLKAGQPIHVVSRWLGHSSVQITLDTYAHVLPGQDEAAVVALVAKYS